MAEKKSFAFGYSQVVNWFLCWSFFGFINAAGINIYRNAICNMYEMDQAPILNVTTIASIIACILLLFLPRAFEKVGAKPFLCFGVMIAGVCWAAGPAMNSVAWVAVCCGIINITGYIFCISASMILVSKWFPRKKGAVMGIISAGSLLATLVLIPVFQSNLASGGPKKAAMVTGVIMIVYGIISLFWLKETPQEVGLLPDNMTEPLPDRNLGASWTRKDVFTCKSWWLAAIGWGLIILAVNGFISIGVSYLLARGVAPERTTFAISIMGICQVIFSVVSGFIDQKIGPKKTSIIVLAIQIFGFIVACTYGGPTYGIIFMAYWLILGGLGADNNLYSSQVLSISGPKNYVVAFSLFVCVMNLIRALNTTVAAVSLTSTGNYEMAYRVFLVCVIVGTVLAILAGDKRHYSKTELEAE